MTEELKAEAQTPARSGYLTSARAKRRKEKKDSDRERKHENRKLTDPDPVRLTLCCI